MDIINHEIFKQIFSGLHICIKCISKRPIGITANGLDHINGMLQLVPEKFVPATELVKMEQNMEQIAALHFPISLRCLCIGQLPIGLLRKAPVHFVIGISGV